MPLPREGETTPSSGWPIGRRAALLAGIEKGRGTPGGEAGAATGACAAVRTNGDC